MEKTLIVRIGEGLGNQLFMYANAYSLSKKFGYNLYIDNESGFANNKRSRSYNLNFFDIPEQLCPEKIKFNQFIRRFQYYLHDGFIINNKNIYINFFIIKMLFFLFFYHQTL